ncbi:hypothetical protein [Cognaticolwellia aestuarii]|uniref:hypothetical protein n=1 Tax=Cognaticolwellia aestuarii TaxID=329993 RepID=UPI0009873EB1|nr:hypothetical protein [Cognaticolwellia aestuarii]
MTYKLTLRRLIFFVTTWGYVVTNVSVAWFSTLSLPLMAVRESWMILLLILLFMIKSYIAITFLAIIAFYGAAPFTEGFQSVEILGFVYGMRDIFLLVMLIELCRYKGSLDVTNREVFCFIYFIVFIAIFDALTTNILGMNFTQQVFRTHEYYSNKGVDINLSNGLLGDRLGAPLYSPNLLCTMLACCFFLDHRIVSSKFIVKILSFIVVVFTMSKVIVFSLAFYIIRSKWKIPVILGLLSLFPFYLILDSYYLTLNSGVLRYHVASTLGHFHAFAIAIKNDLLSFIPEPIGSHSIAMQVINEGTDAGAGIESVILARLSELKIYYLFVITYMLYSLYKLENNKEEKFITFFIVLSLLTATSNQPVAFIPALYLLKARK